MKKALLAVVFFFVTTSVHAGGPRPSDRNYLGHVLGHVRTSFWRPAPFRAAGYGYRNYNRPDSYTLDIPQFIPFDRVEREEAREEPVYREPTRATLAPRGRRIVRVINNMDCRVFVGNIVSGVGVGFASRSQQDIVILGRPGAFVMNNALEFVPVHMTQINDDTFVVGR